MRQGLQASGWLAGWLGAARYQLEQLSQPAQSLPGISFFLSFGRGWELDLENGARDSQMLFLSFFVDILKSFASDMSGPSISKDAKYWQGPGDQAPN